MRASSAACAPGAAAETAAAGLSLARAEQLLVAEEAARRGGAARDRRAGEPVRAELRRRSARARSVRRAADRLAEERGERVEVAAVGLDRARRAPRARAARGSPRASGSRSWGRVVVDAAQSLARRRGCTSASSRASVAEQLLDRAQVGAALEQVGRERVPEPVRVRDEPAQRRGVEPPAAGREEERVLGAARELRAARRAGSARRAARPPRRAGRRGPSRPCRAGRARAPARSRRRRGRARPPRRCAGPAE